MQRPCRLIASFNDAETIAKACDDEEETLL
jgi:hypothetical protein